MGRTHPWVRFLSVLMFVSVALMVLVGVGVGAVGLATADTATAALLFVYPVLGLLYAFPALYMMRYANHTRLFVGSGEPQVLEAALEAQRKFWKFIGIVTIISLGLAVCVFVAGLVLAMLAASTSA